MKPNLPLTLYQAHQVRELDRRAIEHEGIAAIILMERAGQSALTHLQAQWPQARRITVLCGRGNNGGDGYVLARLAYLSGYTVKVLQLGDTTQLTGAARLAYVAMTQLGLSVHPFVAAELSDAEVIVDALLGTGLDRPVTAAYRQAIEAVLRLQSIPVLAMDIPSGLDADTGKVLGLAMVAQVTVTFIGLKRGLFTAQGPAHCGSVYFEGLQVPATIYHAMAPTVARLTYSTVKTALPKRSQTAHKGQFGHVLIIGGDQGMIGALQLAAEAAARVGAGKISVATRATHAPLLSLTRPEIMSHGIETAEQLLALLAQATVVALGPGLGQSPWAQRLFETVMQTDKALIIDADGLNLLAQKPTRLGHSILTPHPGEAGRLLQQSTAEIQADRFAAVQALQQRFGGIVVLKGAGTVIIDDYNQLSLCHGGNPGMACGGMGDVLTGVIAGFVAQGYSLSTAAQLGVCVHAQAGDQAALEGERGLLPSDLLMRLRYVVNPHSHT
ncbi:MAG: NAD(P)H-hydrate dehydratase [Pseudomonadota bacterium]|nr:NAD(P)H-hydrate dehydratase [Pseudomonadota bacterium]